MIDREVLITQLAVLVAAKIALPYGVISHQGLKDTLAQLKADGERIAELEELEQTALAVRTMLMKRNTILCNALEGIGCASELISGGSIQIIINTARQAAKEL